ncbi:MAG: 4Fe-4S binding protein [Candidatus Wallbacteria bacterium]|nr:4Fe-4S binding protein [Candidatus Wallbacteria bacterium]
MTANQKRHVLVQAARRLAQGLSIALVLFLVWLSLYAHYRATRAIEEPALTGGWRGQVLLGLHAAVSRLKQPQAFLDANKGTLWSMRVGGVEVTDPLAVAEASLASRKVHWPLVAGAILPLLLTLFFGRVFCSWICPANVLFELTGKLRSVLFFLEIPPAQVQFSRANKYVLLAGGLSAAAAMGLPFFALVYPPAVLGRAAHAWIFGTAAAGSVAILGLIVIFELFVSPRWWCRTMCPGGAFYALLGACRSLRVRLEAAKCTGCKECFPVCEAGLNPVRESSLLECDNCGACVRHCPEDALSFRVKGPTGLVLALLFACAAPAPAHHILGLPHYSYKDNYPQVPQLEYPATSGPYDILLINCPGKPVPGQKGIAALYIKDRNTGKPYEKPLYLRLLQESLFGQPREVLPRTQVVACEVPYKLAITYPEAGDYVVELTFEVEGKQETIPFPVVAGDPVPAGSILASAGGALVFFLVVVRAVRIKRARRRALGAGAALAKRTMEATAS